MQRLRRSSFLITRRRLTCISAPSRLYPRQVRLAYTSGTNNESTPRKDHGHGGDGGGFSVLTIFSALAAFGVIATGYGLYEYYASLTLWPKELRDDLRAGIKAQHRGDLLLSEKYLRRAWETCLVIPREKLGPATPWLKISGIACKLGEVLEAAGRPEEAYELYARCCRLMYEASPSLSAVEHRRIGAMAIHLGSLALKLGKSPSEEEGWLLGGVEQLIKTDSGNETLNDLEKIIKTKSGDESLRRLSGPEATELGLPKWVLKDGLESALEALGSHYARQGDTQPAVALYLQAISYLLRPESPLDVRDKVNPRDRCKAAQLMNNICNLLIQTPTPERLSQAKLWANKGLELTRRARDELVHSSRPTESECENVYAVLMFNLGAILEMQGDPAGAKEQFERALEQSRTIKLKEGVLEAEDALARLSIKQT